MVILAKDELYASRMTGITEVGEIVSNLFKELDKKTLPAITLLFNKFTDEKDI